MSTDTDTFPLVMRAYAHWLYQSWCDGWLDEGELITVDVEGERPGSVVFLDDLAGVAVVWCDHDDPASVYEAACPDGAEVDVLMAEQITSGPDAGAWLVW